MRFAASLIAAFAAAGCTGELRELDGDMASGGGDAAMQQSLAYATAIQGDLDGRGCTSMACHGGGTPPMHVLANATAPADLAANWGEVKARASSGTSSLLLTKNLAGSMDMHTGGKPFASTMDATYQRWLAWIEAGAPSGLGGGDAGGAADGGT